MWTIIVAGHLYLLNGQPVRTPDQRACLEFATRLQGQCVQEEAEAREHEAREHEAREHEAREHEAREHDAREQWVPPEVTPGMLVPEPVRRPAGR